MNTLSHEPEEIEVLRERSETRHISDIDEETRTRARSDLAAEIEDSFLISGVSADVVEVYVKGSWARGDALPDISDLDVRVVVDCPEDGLKSRPNVEESVRTIVGESLTEGTPFAYVDPRCVRADSDAAEGEVSL